MSKPTGAVCNLDCEYCFFLSKDELYPGSGFRMPAEVHEAYISQLLAAQRGVDEVVVAFQGGEPTLMGIDFFRRTLELEARFAAPGQRILNTLQTNATLLDDEWCAFLRDNDFLVGVSIDGPREMHDAYRVDKGGKPTFDRVIKGLDALKRHGVEWNALTTVNAANGDHGREVYTFLRDELGATFVQLIPIVERVTPELLPLVESGWGRRPGRPAALRPGRQPRHPPHRRRDAVRPVPHRRLRGVGPPRRRRRLRVDVRHRPGALDGHGPGRALRARPHLRGRRRPRAQRRPLLLRPLRRAGLPARQHPTGTHAARARRVPQQRAFGRAKLDTLPAYCRSCDVRFACNGGCPKDRFITTPDGEPGLHYLCAGYQLFFRHVDAPMRVMASLLRQGRDATGLRDWYAAADAKKRPGAGPSSRSAASSE